LLHCDNRRSGGRRCNSGRPAERPILGKALLKPGLLRSNLNSFCYLIDATFKSAGPRPRFQDNIIRIPPMLLERLTRWSRPVLTLLALAGTLALGACGGGSGAVNSPNQPTPTPVPTMFTLPAGVIVAYAQVPTTVKIVGGLPPYQALSNNSAVLPVPLNVSGDTIVLVANPVTPGSDVPVAITVSDSSGQTAIVNVVVRFAPLFETGITVTPSGANCGSNVCDGETASVRAVASGVGGAPLPGRQIRFDVVFGPYAIMTTNPGAPLAPTQTVVTDAAGVAEIQILATANVPTQQAQIRATDVATGQSNVANFIVQRRSAADNLSVIPPTVSITGPTTPGGGVCSTGFIIDYRIFGGTPPYTISTSFPNSVVIVNPTVTQDGGVFRVVTNGSCVNPLTFTIVDAAGKVTTATLANLPGASSGSGPTPPAVTPIVVTPGVYSDNNCVANKTYGFVITGGTAPYNIVAPGVPAGINVTPNPVATTGGVAQVTVPHPFPPAPKFVGTITLQVSDSTSPQQSSSATINCTN
jgi:hypothetical protein